jgi:hypothetical protein
VGATTETIVLYVAKPDLEATRASLMAAADRLGLRLEGVVKAPKLVSTKLTLRVTGEPEQIEILRQMFEGDGWQSGGGDDLLAFLLAPIVNGALSGAHSALAHRWRVRKRRAGEAERELDSEEP